MKFNPTRRGAAYDLGLVTVFASLLAVFIGRQEFPPAIYTATLIVLVAVLGILNTFREAYKESLLDEMQLAAASFGARWAVTIPLTLMLLTIFIPPLQNAALGFTQSVYAVSDSPIPDLLRVFILGMVIAVTLQLAGKSLIAAIWTWSKK